PHARWSALAVAQLLEATSERSRASKVSATFLTKARLPGAQQREALRRTIMARINEHYAKLPASYLFPEIGRRVRAYQAAHPEAKVIRLGIGDVTEPLAPAIVEAMHAAVDEMGKRESFRGYGPEQGYDFLVEAIR